jgi:2-polyprenyl-3-methyl-5-hydroxy-6-metoxy-1,4-benzoquinol methylase
MSALYYGDLPSLNPELMFITEILKLGSLHYGYWDEKEHYDFESLRKAQTKYTKTLMDFIPDHVNTILDVGCGIGDVARALAEKDYRVTAISPDANHVKYFDQPSKGKIKFHNQKFEDLDIDDRFDLIQMIESQNYIDPDDGFTQCRKYLNPGGNILISGMFRMDDSDFCYDTKILKDFVVKAESHGFRIVKSIDITENVLPTMEMAFQAWQGINTLVKVMMENQFDSSTQRKIKLLLFVFNKENKRLTRLHAYYQKRLDPDQFKKLAKYLRLLFVSTNAS